jgi:DNA modification methylase
VLKSVVDASAVASSSFASDVELSGWDEDLLKAELEFLFDAEYDITATGFDLKDLDFSVGESPTKDEPVELPAVDAVAVSRPGDRWLIGDHRLYCGNARDAGSFEALLGDHRADLIFADPPYNVPIAGHVSGLGAVQHREFVEASGEMSPVAFTSFLRPIFRNCVRHSAEGSIHFHCMDWRHSREILDAADGIYSEFKQLVVWAKDNAGMGAFYRSRHELIFVFKNGRARHTNNFGLGETGRYRTNVWEYPGCNTFRQGRDADLEVHPTVKPLAMVMDAILDCSNRGDIVLDPFSGSGTTLCAAHRTHRRGAAIELDPLYVDASLKRLCSTSGLIATLADGRTFEDVYCDRIEEKSHA